MVYGQIAYPDGSFHSVANMLDIVGHEMFHGVTDHTSRLEYRMQAAAFNESYSDILGVIIDNWDKPLEHWTWQLCNGFDGPRSALRGMRAPTLSSNPN